MISLNQLRAIAMALPEVQEGPPVPAARRIASFKVAGKSFLGVEKDARTITVSLAQQDAKAFVAENPAACEEIWRNRKTFMGLRIDLAKISVPQLRQLIEKSWRHSAPRHIAAARGKHIPE